MLWTESLAALGWIVMALVARTPAALLGVAFVSSLLETPYFPASAAAIPNVAGADHLSWANAMLSAGRYVGVTVGPLIGGVLVATVGPRWAFVANAGSYLVSVLLTLSVHANFADPVSRTAEAEQEHRGVFVAGFRFVFRDQVLRTMVFAWSAAMLGLAMALIADPPLAEEFGKGAFGYGMISASWGAGTILGAWLGRGISERYEAWWLIVCTAILGISEIGVGLAPWFWLVLFWQVVFGVADGPTQVVEQNLLQRRTPDVVRSRVMGAWEAMFHLALVGSMILGAVLVPLVGPKGAYVLGGVAGLIGAAILLPLLRWLPAPPLAETSGAHVAG
jgi:MFS family permease